MGRSICINLLLILPLALPAYSQITNAASTNTAQDSTEISRLMTEIEQAFVLRDPAPFERIYLDGYVGVRGRPVYNALEQLIAMVRWDAAAIRSGKKLDFETLSFDTEDPAIRIFGDAAIVTGVKKNLWRYKDSRCLNRYQSTDVFAKVAGQWRLALGHMSLIPCDPMPWQPLHPALSDLRNQPKPTKNLSPAVETEIRELIGKVNEAGVSSSTGADFFATDFVSTTISNEVTNDRSLLIAALRTPTSRASERYRDDEAFLSFGGIVAAYLFRVRSLAKGAETKPDPPVTFSVIFVKTEGEWKIVASHASTISD